MNKIFQTILWLACFSNTYAQFTQKRIGFRRDEFVNNNWVGVDSVKLDYNANADSILKESTKFTNGNWSPLQRNIFTYGANGKVSEYVRQSYVNNAWINGSKFESTYDANENEILQNGYSWVSGSWFLNKRISKQFTATNKIKDELFEVFTSGQWTPAAKNTFVYDGSTDSLNITTALVWNNNKWSNASRKVYFWTTFGPTLIQEEYVGKDDTAWSKSKFTRNYFFGQQLYKTEVKKDSNWTNYSKDTFFYTGSSLNPNRKITSLADTTGLWFVDRKEEYYYNTDTTLQKTEWYNYVNNAAYVLDSSQINFYKSPKLLGGQYRSKFSNGNLATSIRDTFNYNSNNHLIYQLQQDLNANSWVNKQQMFHYYNTQPLKLVSMPTKKLDLFPNPANKEITINLMDSNDDAVISVYHLNGSLYQLINTPVVQGQIKIPVSEWVAGSYIIQVQVSDQLYSTQLIKN